MKGITDATTPYDNRNYKNDYSFAWIEKNYNTIENCTKRIAIASLPFLQFYQPLKQPISIALDCSRVWTTASVIDLSNPDAYKMLQAAIAITALVSTVFNYSIGSFVTTSQDIIIELAVLIDHINKQNYTECLKSLTKITQGALFLVLLAKSSPEIALASIVFRSITLLIIASEDFSKDLSIEAIAHILMACIRLYQGYGILNKII